MDAFNVPGGNGGKQLDFTNIPGEAYLQTQRVRLMSSLFNLPPWDEMS